VRPGLGDASVAGAAAEGAAVVSFLAGLDKRGFERCGGQWSSLGFAASSAAIWHHGSMMRAVCLGACIFVLATAPATAADAPAPGASADIQMSLCAAPAEIEAALKLRPAGTMLQVWLFDDPALSLFDKGLRIRLRETGQGADLTLKAAGQDCAKRAGGRLPRSEEKCEYDLHDGKLVGSLSLTRAIDLRAKKALLGGKPLADELSAAQKRFLQGQPGAWPLAPTIRALGPIRVRSYRTSDKRYAIDVSELPSGERFIEISRKVALADAARVHEQLKSDLAKAGVAACADQSAQAVNKLRALLR
jgi:hypothetical protein